MALFHAVPAHMLRGPNRTPQSEKLGWGLDFADLNGDGIDDLLIASDPTTGSVHVVFSIPPAVEFIRGDADSDGTLNLTDAVYALSFLFLGGTIPICEDAADVDDLGSIELTDAVYLLNQMFLGGAAPPAPYPLAREDPTEDALGCREF